MFLWCFLVCIPLITEALSSDNFIKECQGTRGGLTFFKFKTTDLRYEYYRRLYENCTVIRDNLEIVWFEVADARYDFSFLETIREVIGNVLICGNYVDRIPLNGLRVIRGWKTFRSPQSGEWRDYSLFVASNGKPNNDSIGLKELQLTSLVEITNGDVFFKGNPQLCFGETTVNWDYIKENNPKGKIIIDSSENKRTCNGTCHENCAIGDGRFCWAEGPDMCQAERPCKDCRRGCSDCVCNSECLGGCTGSDESSCMACKNFLKGDRCVDKCNEWRYNKDTFQWEYPPNTTTTYMSGNKCVTECPENMFLQSEACVTRCIPGYMEDKTSNKRNCIPCKDGKCPKTCNGTERYLHGNNLAQFNQCTKVEGRLLIGNFSFFGEGKDPKIKFADLEILKDIEEITGILAVYATHPNLTSLSFLRNLRIIGGLEARSYSLLISQMKPLRSIDLKSLRQIKTGGVLIDQNDALCYAHSINWTRILTSKETTQKVHVKSNANTATCENEGLICSELCSDFGCWGPGDDNCVSCRYYSMDGSCVANCTMEHEFYPFTAEDGTLECGKCLDECHGKALHGVSEL